jgi:hypothetical protein
VVRKLKDFENNRSCLVAYVTTEGTSPALNCDVNQTKAQFRDTGTLKPSGHLREGDLDVYRIVDPDSTKSCLIAYVNTGSTSPSLQCYRNKAPTGKGGLAQTSYFRQGDLIVRKFIDEDNAKECLITYVSTEGTSPHIYCSDARAGATAAGVAPAPAKGSASVYRPTSDPALQPRR